MTTIKLTLEDLRRVKAELEDAIEDHLDIARELGSIRNSLPQMAPTDHERLGSGLDARVKDIMRLALRYAQDAGALGVTIRIAESEESRGWVGGRDLLSLLGTGYEITAEVFQYASERGITIAEAAEELGGGKALAGMATMLGSEASIDKVLAKARFFKVAGIGLEFVEQWSSGEGNWWEAFQRTAVSTGVSSGAAALLARTVCSKLPHLLAKGGCMLVATTGGGLAGDEAVKALFDHAGLTKEEKQTIRASSYPSGLTPGQDRARMEESREGLMAARASLIADLVAQGVDPEEAERIAELNFPDYAAISY